MALRTKKTKNIASPVPPKKKKSHAFILKRRSGTPVASSLGLSWRQPRAQLLLHRQPAEQSHQSELVDPRRRSTPTACPPAWHPRRRAARSRGPLCVPPPAAGPRHGPTHSRMVSSWTLGHFGQQRQQQQQQRAVENGI